jgi:FkbM family methyltransferase
MRKSVIVKSAIGRMYHVEENDTFYGSRLKSSGYQINNLRYFRTLTPNARTIIDVGGHLGTNTIEYATWAKDIKTFEPTSYLRKWLLENIEINKNNKTNGKGWFKLSKSTYAPIIMTGNIEVFPYALSDTEGEETLNTVTRASGHNHIELNFNGKKLTKKGWVKKPESKSTRTIQEKIQTKTLDSFNFKDVDGIKIDVEGLEFQVIKGAVNTIKKYRPVIQTEIQIGMCRRAGYEANELCSYLTDMDYVQTLSDGTIINPSNVFSEVKAKIDRFWIPKEKLKNDIN